MGMFDYLVIDPKWIPEHKRIPIEDQEYQTKSFDNQMDKYEIIESGELLKTGYYDHETKSCQYTGEIYFYDMTDTYIAWCVRGFIRDIIDADDL